MKKRVFIIHGWKSSPADAWLPWLKKELEQKGYDVFVPVMPNPYKPDIAQWLSFLKKEIGEPDENTFLIGHSLGAFISLKYAEEIGKAGKIIGGIITVGGRVHKEGRPNVDPDLVKKGSPKIYSLFSDNDYYIPLSEEVYFRETLGAKTRVLHDRGHFSRLENTNTLPEILPLFSEIVSSLSLNYETRRRCWFCGASRRLASRAEQFFSRKICVHRKTCTEQRVL